MSPLVIGVDPGISTGLVAWTIIDRSGIDPIAVQIHGPEGVVPFVRSLITRDNCSSCPVLLSVEKFVVSTRASRSSTPAGGRAARNLIGALGALAEAESVAFCSWPAATVKLWASDKRLDAAGLLAPTKGMQHARDAARHAIFAAVQCGLMVDPLSRAAASQ